MNIININCTGLCTWQIKRLNSLVLRNFLHPVQPQTVIINKAHEKEGRRKYSADVYVKILVTKIDLLFLSLTRNIVVFSAFILIVYRQIRRNSWFIYHRDENNAEIFTIDAHSPFTKGWTSWFTAWAVWNFHFTNELRIFRFQKALFLKVHIFNFARKFS